MVISSGEGLQQYEFGITGLVNKRELLQPNDQVNFQLDESRRAVVIRAIRKKLIATVDAVKGMLPSCVHAAGEKFSLTVV